ncbi:MAG: hypothetical protein H6656_15755 [Ardenticatenaceae bacterium]|nr:hypothetical protein [Ardenticatenaceae bacterium]
MAPVAAGLRNSRFDQGAFVRWAANVPRGQPHFNGRLWTSHKTIAGLRWIPFLATACPTRARGALPCLGSANRDGWALSY